MTEGTSSDSPAVEGPPEDEPDPLIGKLIAERYRVDVRLGVGGMGAVYRAEHVLMKKPVAVKVLHREMTAVEEVVKRFEREAIAAGRIDHPHVTVATDFGKLDDGAFYLVLEYVPGRSLTDLLAEAGALPTPRALFIARQIADGLGAAHAAGIVHRDLKPDNVMLIERGGTKDFVKVLDFGIAKVSAEGEGGNSQLTRLGAVFGTPAYMSPEQASGQAVDQRADLYSLGLVLYEMIAGHAAFEADELVMLLAKQLTEPPPPLPQTVDASVSALVMRLLEKDPRARFQSAAELIAEIDAYLGSAAPPPDSMALGAPSARGLAAAGATPPAGAVAATVATAVTATSSEGLSAPSSRREAAPAPSVRERGATKNVLAGLVARLLGGDTVRMAGRDVPLWLFGAAAGAALMGVALALGMFRAHAGPAPAAGRAAPPPPELSSLIARAEEGDRSGITALESRPEKGRTAAEWMAIGKGHAKLVEHHPALEAFQRAVGLDSGLASDAGMLHAVRRAAEDDAAQKEALDFAATALGPDGADVLFDVWATTSGRTDATVLAKSLLDRPDVRAHASKPLQLALDLRRLTRCDDFKHLLPEVVASGDERATRPLTTTLVSRKGCGFLRLADCFPCLRQDDTLGEAQRAAQARKAPHF